MLYFKSNFRIFANFSQICYIIIMKWKITYYSEQVTMDIKKWPKKLLAKYLRIIDLIEEQGPNLGEPLTKKLDK